MTNKELYRKIETLTPKSAWRKGVKAYALELIEKAEAELTRENAKEVLLNGAENWSEYSYGGNALIYNGNIVEMLCTPGEVERFKNGEINKPNTREEWLDVQARALSQACELIIDNLFTETKSWIY